MKRLRLVMLLSSTLSVTSTAAAQDDDCIFRIEHIGGQGTTQETPSGTNYFAGGGVRLFCEGTQIRMESDSLAAYNGGEITYFIGNVHYRDSTMALDADRGTYFQDRSLWEARGNVYTRNLETGSTLRGPSLDYFRATPGVRSEPEMYAIGRPQIDYAMTDSTGQAGDPYVIVADRVRLIGDDRIWAGGAVTIDRSDFAGRGDSLWLDAGLQRRGALIGGRPEIAGSGDNPYRLTGERIDLELDQQELRRVVSVDSAHAVNEEWDLLADTIGVHLANNTIERIEAWGSRLRPLAQSEARTVSGDSVVLQLPGGQLRELWSFGDARLETAPDSLTGESDWLAGDTVTALFTVADSVTGEGSALDRLIARSDARSFRQVRSDDAPFGRPSLNYVRGSVIVITMKEPPGEGVARVDVRGQVEGVQLEPVEGAPAPDSLPEDASPGERRGS